ncbi:hypothetical protein OG879_28850 [Streptomyces caniferus]|nr:hypothetical protein [Streptomyces caniferus]
MELPAQHGSLNLLIHDEAGVLVAESCVPAELVDQTTAGSSAGL